MRARALGVSLWRELVEHVSEGVLVFNERGLVIYANPEAARLLGYTTRDLLELDLDDFLALCYADRLDFVRFAELVRGGQVPAAHQGAEREEAPPPPQDYELVTTERRLRVRPLRIDMDEESQPLVLFLEEPKHWPGDLVAQTVLSEALRGPLSFSLKTARTLLSRIDAERDGHPPATPFELADLARMVYNGLDRSLKLWQMLERFYGLSAGRRRYLSQAGAGPITALPGAFAAAIQLCADNDLLEGPQVALSLPEDLPPVYVPADELRIGLAALLEGMSLRLSRSDVIAVAARRDRQYVRITAAAVGSSGSHYMPDSYALDQLPLALTDQIMMRHGGRIWVKTSPARGISAILMLPIAADEEGAA